MHITPVDLACVGFRLFKFALHVGVLHAITDNDTTFVALYVTTAYFGSYWSQLRSASAVARASLPVLA